ncbi:glycosyltransferase [Zoogloea oleivorans]|uniref:Glycosyltransferase n=1 Tax=Zoogloea oleivorans TaxID=1552750 RepID=A0A6C2CEG2_9RHOO|nr:glycosyltransferase [Zoogloea oleivorans]TYC51813.1 glycosyltransferase [Zoogloea oleivorans]
MDKSNRFVLFINTLGSGGAQRQIVLLARELSKVSDNVFLVHYGNSEHMVEMLGGSSVRVVRVQAPFGRWKGFLFINLVLEFLKIRPTHVVSFIDAPNKIFGALAFLIFRRVVWVPSERNLVVGSSFRETFWRSLLYRRARNVISNSHSQNKWMHENISSQAAKCSVIINGVPGEMFSDEICTAENGEIKKFVALGRLGYQKNPMLLIDTLRLLLPEVRKSIFVDWYGEDDPDSPGLRESLESTVKLYELPIRFHRATRDVSAVLDSADAFILCSRFEGTPNVVLEAMARGKVVLASSVSDVPLLLSQGRGFLFESESTVGFSKAILDCLSQPMDKALKMGEDARFFVKHECSATSMSKNYLRALGLAVGLDQ